jgi:hypothetical protein
MPIYKGLPIIGLFVLMAYSADDISTFDDRITIFRCDRSSSDKHFRVVFWGGGAVFILSRQALTLLYGYLSFEEFDRAVGFDRDHPRFGDGLYR